MRLLTVERMAPFGFKRLDVYKAALEFFEEACRIAERIPRHRGYVADQWLRAALSVLLNLGEGAGEYSGREKAKFFRIARRSATECAALLDALRAMNVIDVPTHDRHEELLARITAMLTRLAKLHETRGTLSTRTSTSTST